MRDDSASSRDNHPVLALGVDVGMAKGLDLVLLDEARRIVCLQRRLPHSRFREVVLDWAPDVVAIDSPPRWAAAGGGRATEAAVRRLGIHLYVTPAIDRRSQAGFHDWMEAGMAAYRAIEDRFPLFNGIDAGHSAMEVFPHGSAVVLAGGRMPDAITKHQWRRQVLQTQAIDTTALTSPDLVDAALAALTGLIALAGGACWLGEPAEGVIVLPCLAIALPHRYVRLAS